MKIVIILVVIALLFYLQWIIAGLFKEIVYLKGHADYYMQVAWRLCFWLGIVGYFYVIALPNKSKNTSPQ